MDTITAIKTRRSIRRYVSKKIDEALIKEIVEAGSLAPSGLNNQPWRFIVVEDKDMIDRVSRNTKYSHVIKNASVIICVYLDKAESYNYIKDVQAIGACIQNMLLFSHAHGLGSCWMGEILNKAEQVNTLMKVPTEFELMAVITLGYPAESGQSERKKIDDLVYGWLK
ncbi:MAG: nitroreductase family protein [bacterium]